MKTQRMRRLWSLASFLALSILLIHAARGEKFPGLMPLDSWSFTDSSNWADDYGDLPISFTNIAWAQLGNGSSMVVETNVPAWLNYEIYQADIPATNIVVNGPGSIAFWFGPGWATTNGGPGQWAQLIDCGEETPGSTFGYFGLSIDPPGSNVWFFSQDGLGNTYSLSTPILWTTNYFHMIGLTYSSTNVSLYIDGQLATNDPGGLSIWPGPSVVPNGVYFGSDTNGDYRADGLFNLVQTFDSVLDSNMVAGIYNRQVAYYELSPWNVSYMGAMNSATSNPSYTPTYEAVTGLGNLILLSNVDDCANASVDDVWITNVTASLVGSGTNASMNIAFTIKGGESGFAYDVFANSVLHGGTNGAPWAWMGQGYPCGRYLLTNMPTTHCFIILGTPYTSNPGLGLTDAYELLVLQISPNGPQFDNYGVPYAWYAQHGLGGGAASQDPDLDALFNYQEYLFGTNPQVSEGFAVWVSTPNGTSGIP